MSDERLVLSTAESHDEAARIAEVLVQESLAACVNVIGPIESVYRWKGKVESAKEFLLLIKTTAEKSRNAIARVQQLHSYELPEAIEIDICGGSSEYLRWMRGAVDEKTS